MNDRAEDKIEQIYADLPKRMTKGEAREVTMASLQALLADLDTHIIEYDPDAELPNIIESEHGDSDHNYKYYAFGDVCKAAQQDMKDDGWVKRK